MPDGRTVPNEQGHCEWFRFHGGGQVSGLWIYVFSPTTWADFDGHVSNEPA